MGWRGELVSGCGWEFGLLSRVAMSALAPSQKKPPRRAGEAVSSAPSSGKGLLVSFVGPEAVTARPLGPAVGCGPARCGLRSPLPDSDGFCVVEWS